jgi:ParB/RepB/Spo0J family partition protein
MVGFDVDAIMAKAKSMKDNVHKDILKESTLPAANLYSGDSSISIQNIRRLTAIEIEPRLCRPWKFHNRDNDWLTQENCSDLIRSISANGQIEPGLVRKLDNDPDYEYEIIYGARRWYACSQIKGKKFLARVGKSDDRESMILMHIENADSKDISDFERAYSFLQQLRSGVFVNQKDLALAMNVSQGLITRMLQAAEIFDYDFIQEVIKTKRDLPIRSCQLLSSFLKQAHSRNNIKAKCQKLKLSDSILPKDILKLLIAAANESEEITKAVTSADTLDGVTIHVDSKGRLSIILSSLARKQSAVAIRELLAKAVDKYLN